MNTHNIPFSQKEKKKKKKENHPKLSQICSYVILFQGPQEGVRNSRGKRPFCVRAIEVLRYRFDRLTGIRSYYHTCLPICNSYTTVCSSIRRDKPRA